MIRVEQLTHLHLPDRGYVEPPSWTMGLKIPEEYYTYLTQPATRYFIEYYAQTYMPKAHLVALSHVWPSQEKGFWSRRKGLSAHSLVLSERDYFKLKAYPASLEPFFQTDDYMHPITIDENNVAPPVLRTEEAKWLIESFSQEELKGLLAVLWLHKNHAEYKATITVPFGMDPLDIIRVLLKLPAYPCRPISYMTSPYVASPPEGGYGLVVYQDKVWSVAIENCDTAHIHDIVQDSLDLINLAKVHDYFNTIFEALSERCNPSTARYYALIEYSAKGEETLKWLAQEYIKNRLYTRAAELLGRITVA